MNNQQKCINCGKFPFCEKIENSQKEACENYIERKFGINIVKEKGRRKKCIHTKI